MIADSSRWNRSEADEVVRRLAPQVDERRHPRTNATLDQLLDRYLATLDVGRTTQRMCAKYLEKHVRPFLGRLKVGAVDAEALDSLYVPAALDLETVAALTEHVKRCSARAAAGDVSPWCGTFQKFLGGIVR